MGALRKRWWALRDTAGRFFSGIETRQVLLRAAGRALLGIFLIWLNPFDLFHKADEASSNAFQVFVTPFIHHTVADPGVTVILFTASSLKNIREAMEDDTWTWPLSFDQQAKILQRIVTKDYKPLAIFYDIEFYQPRGNPENFRKALSATTGVDTKWDCNDFHNDVPLTPVLMAAPPDPETIFKDLCGAGVQAVNVNWSGRPNVYPLAGIQKNKSDHHAMVSPAAALFMYACFRPQHFFPYENCFFRSTADFAGHDPANLVWRSDYGTGDIVQQEKFQTFFLNECDYSGWFDENGAWPRLIRFLRSAFSRKASSRGEETITTCPAPVVIGADQIFLHPKDNSALIAALQNRVVLIGADLPGLRDRVATPFHGMVPGVFAHATAFDNLAERGEHYISASRDESFFNANRVLQFLVVWLALCATVLTVEHLTKRLPPLATLAYERKPAWRDFRAALVTFLDIFALAALTALGLLLLSMVFFFGLHEAPLDWIGELAIVWIIAFDEIVAALGRALAVFPLRFDPVRAAARHFLEHPKENPSHAAPHD